MAPLDIPHLAIGDRVQHAASVDELSLIDERLREVGLDLLLGPSTSEPSPDFIRMAAISGLNVKMAGSHAGVSIGEDGASQMALEDLAMMSAEPKKYQCLHGERSMRP